MSRISSSLNVGQFVAIEVRFHNQLGRQAREPGSWLTEREESVSWHPPKPDKATLIGHATGMKSWSLFPMFLPPGQLWFGAWPYHLQPRGGWGPLFQSLGSAGLPGKPEYLCGDAGVEIPMSLWQFAILGALGGALVEALELFKWITVWQGARRLPTGELRPDPPGLRIYVDVPAHVWLLFIRGLLGAIVALLFGATEQISGVYAAVAFGFAAPAVLAQLGSFPQVEAAVTTDGSTGREQVGH
jgi:hypothetical protein